VQVVALHHDDPAMMGVVIAMRHGAARGGRRRYRCGRLDRVP
jgi:hypothetical protein